MASSVLVFRFRFLRFPRSLQPDLSCFPSRFRYSAFCLFPFVLPCFAPTAVPQVLAFCFRFRPFPFLFRFLSSASFPVLTTQPSVSSVPFFLSSPLSGFSSAPVLPFGFPAFHLLFRLVSHASFPVSGTWLSVCFLSSFPVSLPQPFHRCFPSFPLPLVRFSSGLFCLLSAFFRPLQPASDYSAFRSFFSLLPVLPCRRFLRCSPVSFVPFAFLFRPACFHAFLPIPVLSFLQFLSPSAVSPHSGYLSASAFSLSGSGLVPMAFALGSGYSALGLCLSTYPAGFADVSPQPTCVYYYSILKMSTHFLNVLINCFFL